MNILNTLLRSDEDTILFGFCDASIMIMYHVGLKWRGGDLRTLWNNKLVSDRRVLFDIGRLKEPFKCLDVNSKPIEGDAFGNDYVMFGHHKDRTEFQVDESKTLEEQGLLDIRCVYIDRNYGICDRSGQSFPAHCRPWGRRKEKLD